MAIAKPGSWLAGYIQGTAVVFVFKSRGYAIGKGQIKKTISNWILYNKHVMDFDSSRGFIDAIMDSVN